MQPTKWSIEYYESTKLEEFLRETTNIVDRWEQETNIPFSSFFTLFFIMFDSMPFCDGNLYHVEDTDGPQKMVHTKTKTLVSETVSSILDLLGGKERRIVVKV